MLSSTQFRTNTQNRPISQVQPAQPIMQLVTQSTGMRKPLAPITQSLRGKRVVVHEQRPFHQMNRRVENMDANFVVQNGIVFRFE